MAVVPDSRTDQYYNGALLGYTQFEFSNGTLSLVFHRVGNIYVYFQNVTVDGQNYGSPIVTDTVTLMSKSVSGGSYHSYSFTCPWSTGSVTYSAGGTAPADYTPPTGLAVSNITSTYNSITAIVSIDSWGNPGGSANSYLELNASSTNSSDKRRFQKYYGDGIYRIITVTNESEVLGGERLKPNTLYHLWGFATNTQVGVRTENAITKATLAHITDWSYAVGEDSITFTFEIDPEDGGYAEKAFAWSFDNWEVEDHDDIPDGVTTYTRTIDGLTPGTEYTIDFLVGTYYVGTALEDQITFTTLSGDGKLKIYGSRNNLSKRLGKIYASVSGVTVPVKKLYASVNGQTKLVYGFNNVYSRLPSELQEVEYLESSGTQYIDTGVTAGASKGFSAEYIEKEAYGTDQGILAATSNASYDSTARWGIWIWYARKSQAGNENNWQISFPGKYVSSYPYTTVNGIHYGGQHIEMHYNLTGNGAYSIEGDSVSFSGTVATGTNTYPSTIAIFRVNLGNGRGGRYAYIKLEKCLIYDGGITIREFVPCYVKSGETFVTVDGETVSGGTAGLYDLKTNQLYVNSGTGADFTVGPDVI